MLWRSILLALMWCSHVNSSKWGEALDDFAASAAGTAASLEYCLLRTAAHALYCNPGKLPPNDAKFLGFLFSSLPLSTAVQQQKREREKKKKLVPVHPPIHPRSWPGTTGAHQEILLASPRTTQGVLNPP